MLKDEQNRSKIGGGDAMVLRLWSGTSSRQYREHKLHRHKHVRHVGRIFVRMFGNPSWVEINSSLSSV